MKKSQLKNRSIRIATYARVSSDKQAKEETVVRQQYVNASTLKRLMRDLEDYEPSHVGDYSDEGYNFESIDEDTQFWGQVIPQIKKGSISHLIVPAWDRIFRGKSSELNGKIEDILRANKITLVADNGSTYFSSDDTQARLTTSLMTNLGVIQKLELVKVMHSGRRRKLEEEGEWFLSIAPYGYRIDRDFDGRKKKYTYTVVEEEASVVKEIFFLYTSQTQKLGSNRIAEIINKKYPQSRKYFAERNNNFRIKSEWDRQAIVRLLRTRMYIGELDVTFDPTPLVSGFSDVATNKTIFVDPIVPRKLFESAQNKIEAIREKLIDDRQPRRTENWLHGLIQCPLCDEKYVGRLQKFRWYGCPNLHGSIVRADDIEARVKEILDEFIFDTVRFGKLAEQASGNSGIFKEVDRLSKEEAKQDKELKNLEGQLDALTLKNLKGIIDDEQYVRARNIINNEKASCLEVLKVTRFKMKNLSQQQEVNPKAQYQKILPLIVEKVLSPTDYRAILEGLHASVYMENIKVSIDINSAPKEVVNRLYKEGHLVLKDFINVGWSTTKIYNRYGKTGRKVPIDWRPIVKLPWVELRGWLPEGLITSDVTENATAFNKRVSNIDISSQRA